MAPRRAIRQECVPARRVPPAQRSDGAREFLDVHREFLVIASANVERRRIGTRLALRVCEESQTT
jgi:hypothetical protein